MAGKFEDVITLGSSSEEEEEDQDVLPIVRAPPAPKIGVSTPPRKGTKIIHLSASKVGPKIQPKPAPVLPQKNNGHINKSKMNGTKDNKPCDKDDDVICLSSSDDDNERIVPEIKAKVNGQQTSSSLNRRRGQQEILVEDDNQPSTSAACRNSITINNNDGGGSTVVIKDETNDENAQIILQGEEDDDDNEEQKSHPTANDVSNNDGSVCTDATDNIERLRKVLNPKLSFGDRKKFKTRIYKLYGKLAGEPYELHEELSKRIALVINHVAENSDMNLIWKLLSQLVKQFNADVLRNDTFSITYTEDELVKIEKRKEKRIRQLEVQLMKYSNIVKELDEAEVDWDSEDDNNSAFMQRDRTIGQIMRIHDLICKITKSSKLTGRPIQKAIKIKNTTKYPEVENAVEKFVNSSGYSEAPEFWDILDVVETSSTESKLHLSESDKRDLAKTLHKAVIDRRQQLRELDVPLAFPPACDSLQDPAELDPELEEKLQQNAKEATTIKSVVDEFVEKQDKKKLKDKKDGKDEEASEADGDEEEDDDSEDEDDEENDGSSIIESGSCFVTSVEEEEEAAVDAWDEPLYDGEELEEESPLVEKEDDLPTMESRSSIIPTPSNLSEAETIVAEEENSNSNNNGIIEIQQQENNNGCESTESINEIDESPPPIKKVKMIQMIDDNLPASEELESSKTLTE